MHTLGSEISLEDELGDVLDKALQMLRLRPETAAERAGIDPSKLLDALDWRSELNSQELQKLAGVLGLNEVGLCALAQGQYPRPETGGLPFCLHALRMPHGIGVVNAYLVCPCGSEEGLLFDTGPGLEALVQVWPKQIRRLEAVFLTHPEAEHSGGLCAVVQRFKARSAWVPPGAAAPCGQTLGEGQTLLHGSLRVRVLHTPGHAAAHNCYVVESLAAPKARSLLISGDLLYAGSVGCALFCATRLRSNLRRLLTELPETTLVAPGHGPLTTLANERRFNPFASF